MTRTRTEEIMLAGCRVLAILNFVMLVGGILAGIPPEFWLLNLVCGGVVGFMSYVIWDDTR